MPDLSVKVDLGEARRLVTLQSSMPSVIQSVLRDSLKTLMTRVQRDTPVGIVRQNMPSGAKRKKGMSQVRWKVSGALKASWLGQVSGDSVEVKANVPKWKYPWVLEEGKYPGIGKLKYGQGPGGTVQVSPRTVNTGGGIFSSRAPRGILSPIVSDTELLGKITTSILDQLRRTLD